MRAGADTGAELGCAALFNRHVVCGSDRFFSLWTCLSYVVYQIYQVLPSALETRRARSPLHFLDSLQARKAKREERRLSAPSCHVKFANTKEFKKNSRICL